MSNYPSIQSHDVYTTGELADLFDRSNQTIRRWIKEDRLPASKDSSGRFVVHGKNLIRVLDKRPGLRSKINPATKQTESDADPPRDRSSDRSPDSGLKTALRTCQGEIQDLRADLNKIRQRVDDLTQLRKTVQDLETGNENEDLRARVANLEAVLDEMQTLQRFKKNTP